MTSSSSANSAYNSSEQHAPKHGGGRHAQKKQQKEKKTYPWWVEIPIIVVVTLLILGAFNTFVGRLYLIPSESMEPTLHGCAGCTPDRIFVNKMAYLGGKTPKPGDVVVFVGEESWNSEYVSQRSKNNALRGIQNGASYIGLLAPDENTLVKRVIATGGQTVQCLEGDPGVMVDGKKLNEPYINPEPEYPVNPATGSEACGGDYFGPITVPDGNLWLMGDNRTNSLDSRGHMGDENQGTIPVANVVGRVESIVLPFSRIGSVDSVDNQGAA
ncbi:signal peptidase I [Corynebacterium anserum]|uniref:Signal peptidase I n=1 Tax=Corynebacterium anserum TaxID=2684406 RepID=A0A7G7YNW0_9CORY|nr:signal peptidase I [Corynebacterium anserum]MBC2681777.1 signal peptidase I [Corynebacterium anserum]QNH96180.1 signal peptidase I [Corynebacterium anserum]